MHIPLILISNVVVKALAGVCNSTHFAPLQASSGSLSQCVTGNSTSTQILTIATWDAPQKKAFCNRTACQQMLMQLRGHYLPHCSLSVRGDTDLNSTMTQFASTCGPLAYTSVITTRNSSISVNEGNETSASSNSEASAANDDVGDKLSFNNEDMPDSPSKKPKKTKDASSETSSSESYRVSLFLSGFIFIVCQLFVSV